MEFFPFDEFERALDVDAFAPLARKTNKKRGTVDERATNSFKYLNGAKTLMNISTSK